MHLAGEAFTSGDQVRWPDLSDLGFRFPARTPVLWTVCSFGGLGGKGALESGLNLHSLVQPFLPSPVGFVNLQPDMSAGCSSARSYQP